MDLDTWQQEILAHEGNIVLRSGRQVGKSTVISLKAGRFAINNPNKVVMIIASTERQAFYIFNMVIGWMKDNHPNEIVGRPTSTFMQLKNKAMIRCLPAGDTGYGIRGYTVDLLIADEAAFINESVWQAITPMLATTKGKIILLSTPFGIENYFARCFEDPKFKSWHISSEDCPRIDKEWLAHEKETMTRMQYQQEYLGLFVGGIQRFLPDDLINDILTVKEHKPVGDKFQGIDIARMGGDDTVMVSGDRIKRKKLVQFDMEIPEPQKLTDTARLIIKKDKTINHKKIFMDDGGLGVGVYDILYEDPQTKRKVVGLNNASREIERKINQGKTKIKSKTLLGIDMAINLKVLMENNKIQLFDDPRIRQSLRSMQCDYSEGKLRIYGNFDHIFEALKRLAHCMKDKTLNIMPFCK